MERGKRETYRPRLEVLLPLAAAGALLVAGLWMRWPTVGYDGPASQDAYNQFAFDRFAYSDVASLYFRDGLAGHPRPYLDYQLEYPVETGLLIYLLNSVTRDMPQYFLLTSLWMTVSALWIAALVPCFPRGRLALFALSPALALYVNVNWDMWGILLMLVALLLFVRERDSLGAAVLAAAVWTKFFPIVFLPFVIADRLLHRGRRAAARITVVFTLASVAINAPVLLLAPGGWWYFFTFNAGRTGEPNSLWGFFDPSRLSVEEINQANILLLLWGLAVLLLLQRRSPPDTWLPAGCAMLAWFFFVNKVYSPQYSLWIVALLAVTGSLPALVVAWSVDLLYFGAQFALLGLSQYGDAQGWFEGHVFVPAVGLREMPLLVVVGWCVKQIRAPAQDRGERPRGSPAGVA